jgi:hypothetical protein
LPAPKGGGGGKRGTAFHERLLITCSVLSIAADIQCIIASGRDACPVVLATIATLQPCALTGAPTGSTVVPPRFAER